MEKMKKAKKVYIRQTKTGEVREVLETQAKILTAKPDKGEAKWELHEGKNVDAALKGQITKLKNSLEEANTTIAALTEEKDELLAKVEELEELEELEEETPAKAGK